MPSIIQISENNFMVMGGNEREMFSIGSKAKNQSGVYTMFGKFDIYYKTGNVGDCSSINLILQGIRAAGNRLNITVKLGSVGGGVNANGAGVISAQKSGPDHVTTSYLYPSGITYNLKIDSQNFLLIDVDYTESLGNINEPEEGGNLRFLGPFRLLKAKIQNPLNFNVWIDYVIYIVKYPG